MNNRLSGRIVIVFGATGGLGHAIVKACYVAGMTVVAVGRKEQDQHQFAEEFGENIPYMTADVTQPQDIRAVYLECHKKYGKIDVVVNASGYDARKSLAEHTEADIDQTLSVNLRGAVFITQIFLQLHTNQYDAVVVHLGGFGDGRLAFPFYSVNVASRAGLRAFIESVNREMQVLNRRLRVTYFGPTSANTKAERPFHPMWQEMGVTIVEPDTVARHLLQVLSQPHSVYVMGLSARVLATINAVSPALANWIVMNRYSKILASHLAAK